MGGYNPEVVSNEPRETQTPDLVHRQEIARLFAEFESAVEADAIYEFQLHLANAIRAVEPVAFRDKSSPQRDHLRRLRLLGDALAWRLLHPYAIRQLAKNQGGAQALSTQSGFASTLRMAEREAEHGHPVLVCDLTNCLRVGDVLVCSDPEHPVILESGGHPRFKHKGRKRRQAERARAITELLTTGAAQLHGEAATTETVEIAITPDHCWHTVDRVVSEALKAGEAWVMDAPGDVIHATRGAGDDFQMPHGLEDVLNEFGQPVFTLVTMLEKPNLRAPPAPVWPIAAEARLALMRSDVFLLHWVDLDAFPGPAPGGELVAVDTKGQDVTGFRVRAAGVIQHLAPHFLDDVLLGFQTIASTRAEMVAAGLAALPADLEGSPRGPERVNVDSLEDARALLRDPERLRGIEYVSMPVSLWGEVQVALKGDQHAQGDG